MGSANYSRPIVTTAASLGGLTAPDGNTLAFGSFAAAINQATAVTVVTTTDQRAILDITNTLNTDMILVVNGVNTNLRIRATSSRLYDLQPALKSVPSGATLALYAAAGVAPASGDVTIQLI